MQVDDKAILRLLSQMYMGEDNDSNVVLNDRCAEVYAHLLSQLPATPFEELDFVPPAHRAQLLAWAAPRVAVPEATIDELFIASVRAFPDHPALTSHGDTLSYAELDRRVDRLARHLVARGIAVGDRVAILLRPSSEAIVAMLGALRAGAVYVPIDVDLPRQRIDYILRDSGAKYVIDGAEPDDAQATLPRVGSRDGAYLIYTSGTTGEPKGVLVEHRSLVNYVVWFRERYGIDSSHRGALLTSFAFDLGYTTLWTTLLSGGHLHVLADSLDVTAIPAYFDQHGITFIKVTPSLLSALLATRGFERCESLRLVVTGGENVRPDDIATLYARCPGVLAVNHYGPTETTIGVTTFPIEDVRAFARRPVIGRPIGNVKAYVASANQQLLPIGAIGELLIGGDALARGYHQREELTRAKFIADPFASSGYVYRTGDLVRWTDEGTLEFLGRIDRQVKIRGYRVELSEIERVMLRQLPVREAIVLDRVVGDALCAYYVGDTDLDDAETCATLAAVLPDYMIPLYYVRIPAIPRSANGKLDASALPAPGWESADEPPQSQTEQVLRELWSDVLGVEAACISVSQNFFELGGHSLLMIQLIAEIHDRFEKTVPMPLFFEEGTIRALATFLDGAGA